MYLLASDFDNTLWFRDHLLDDDVYMIKEFQRQGHLFGLCTGRGIDGIVVPCEGYDMLEHLSFDFYILSSGAYIMDKDRHIIFEKMIPMDIVEEVYKYTDHGNMSILTRDHVYKLYKDRVDHYPAKKIQSLDEIRNEEVRSFSIHYEEDEIAMATVMKDHINDLFGKYISAFQNGPHIDIAAVGCSKGEGIRFIQEYFHLDDEYICGIGDNFNDLPMLEAVEHSYTFDYAPNEVQEKAKYVVPHLSDCIKDILKNKAIIDK
ncbi:MAG: HAD family hydrolase [Erysipelotrichaceae bacterium]|nr:HAD family hydrolase [Erysipelotrichaceae bacterium]